MGFRRSTRLADRVALGGSAGANSAVSGQSPGRFRPRRASCGLSAGGIRCCASACMRTILLVGVLGLHEGLRRRLPASFEFLRDQAMLKLRLVVLPSGTTDFIAQTL